MDWRKTYPSVATLKEANFTTLDTWRTHLPPPQTDVERTVQRRLERLWVERGNAELRKNAPDLAARLDAIMEKMRAAGIPLPPDLPRS